MNLDARFDDQREGFTARLVALAAERDLANAVDGMVVGATALTGSLAGLPGKHDRPERFAPQSTPDPAADRVATPVAPSPDSRSPTLIVPGLLGDSVRALVAPLAAADAELGVQGYDIDVAWVSGRSGCDRNAATLYPQVMATAERHGGPIHLIGYSKGCPDVLHMLANHPACHEALLSVVSLAGVVRGTPLAAHSPGWLDRIVQYLPLPGVRFGDGRALDDLAPGYRQQWLERHPMPNTIRYASVVAAPTPERVSRILRHSYRRLLTFDPHNDSQVIATDAIIPGSELLAVINADHWAAALPITPRLPLLSRWLIEENDFPRNLLLQAIIDHLDTPR